MTTATRRLRRASIAGLATIATAGVTVLASGGTALAFVAGDDVVVAASSNATLSVGGSNQALGNITVKFPANNTTAEFSAGEQLEFVLDSTGTPAVNDTTGNTLNTASFAAAPTVTVDNGATAPTVALASENGTNDAFKVTFTKDAPINTTATTLTISGIKVNLGSAVGAGQNLEIVAGVSAGSAGNIFDNAGTPAQTSATVTVGTLPKVSMSTSKVANAAPGGTVTLGTISIKDVTGGNLKAGDVINVNLTNGTWVTAPTAAGTPGLTSAGVTIAGATASFTIGSTASVAGNTITLTGGAVKPTAAGSVSAALVDTTNAIALSPTGVALAVGVSQARDGGADRYGTASLIYSKIPTPSTTVVLTSGANFPDALSAQYLASQLSAPGSNVGILTTTPDTLSQAAQQRIVAGAVTTVYIVGGTAAVSTNVENQLKAMRVSNSPIAPTLSVIRIGGADRFATNSQVDLLLGISKTHAYVATGNSFPDALAIGPAVYASGDPLVLTDGGTLSPAAASTLQSLGITDVTIVGGTSAVTTGVETAIKNLNITIDGRLAGADRTQTAAAIATYESTATASGGLGWAAPTNVFIARGDNFADALVAGPLAGVAKQPILLTNDPNTLGAGIPSFLGAQANGQVTTVTALGLTGAVSIATLNAAAASLG